ncbi:hypothetical protein A0O28_0015050 [Trichoderma guizhouense]|uniref:Uncharacterized protein n=1 Tax=Trichoderma guizhouense TaxID=1491466 RepID=A0A1T3CBE6_9HYPO|nr:hypothetical protein A0O28_0015050 [Trichoderma guizhouense]
MSAPNYAMEDRDVLYHAQVTLGCNGLRDLYNLGFMRQDTLERRIKAAGKRINLNSTVSLCAVWLREKIGRTFSTTGMGTRPEIKDLCLFLERRGCSRDMCCQTFYDAFQRVKESHANQVSLRVGNVVLTSFRAIVDHIYDHWYQWLDEPETPAGVVDLEQGQQNNDDGKLPPYPAYNHDLAMLSPAELNLRLETSLEQLHQGHDHHSRRDNDDAKRGAQKRQHPGYCAPFDLGQASSWGSEPNQSDRCATRLQDCASALELMKPLFTATMMLLVIPKAVCHLRRRIMTAETQRKDLGITPQTQDEARKKQKMDEEYAMESSLLDSSLEMGSGQGVMTDINLGVDNKPIHGDASYSPFVQDLFRGRGNLWIRKVKRPTALDMWDASDSTTLKDADQS